MKQINLIKDIKRNISIAFELMYNIGNIDKVPN